MEKNAKSTNINTGKDNRIDSRRGKPLLVSIVEVIKKLKKYDSAISNQVEKFKMED